MRLNRVLLLAAVISMAMFAMVFTISCSGEDGSNGRDGTSRCNVQQVGSGYDVFCDGKNAGTLQEATKGPQGPTGPVGQAGTDCNIEPNGRGYDVFCNGELKGTLEGCKTSNDGVISISCVGSTTFSVCGPQLLAFNSDLATCNASGGLDSKVGNCAADTTVKYRLLDQYCGYTGKANFDAGKVSAICLGNYATTLNTSTQCAALTTTTAVCKGIKPNADTTAVWKDEYCKVTATKNSDTGEKTITAELGTPELCAPTSTSPMSSIAPQKFNQGSWKGQYCGYADASTKVKSILNNACDDGEFPDEQAYLFGYCQLPSPTAKAAVYVEGAEQYCGGKRDATKRINPAICQDGECRFVGGGTNTWAAAQAINGTITEGTFQFCGFAVTPTTFPTTPTAIANTKSLITRAANQGGNACALLAPNSGEEAPTDLGDVQFCQGYKDGDLKLVTMSDGGCNASSKTTWTSINEGSYVGQYCGWATFGTSNTAFKTRNTLATSECVNGLTAGINTDDAQPATADDMQYCQVSKDNNGNIVVNAITPKDDGGSCNQTALTKLNENEWKAQYCGWTDNVALAKTVQKIPGPIGGPCEKYLIMINSGESKPASADAVEWCQVGFDGVAKAVSFAVEGIKCENDITKLNQNEWKGQYCGYASAGTGGTKSVQVLGGTVGSSANTLCKKFMDGLNMDSQPEEAKDLQYCMAKIGGVAERSTPAANACNQKTNENEWKGETCVPCVNAPAGTLVTATTNAANGFWGHLAVASGGSFATAKCFDGYTGDVCKDDNGEEVAGSLGEAACKANKNTWTIGCSDPTLATQILCEAPKGTWTPKCSEASLATQTLCEAKGTWTPKCSEASLATQTLCEAPKGTWTPKCSDASLATQTLCEAPKGTWDDGGCSVTSQKTWVNCVAAGGTWTVPSCSDNTLTTKGACETLKGTWGGETNGTCSEALLTNKTDCEAPKVGNWVGDYTDPAKTDFLVVACKAGWVANADRTTDKPVLCRVP